MNQSGIFSCKYPRRLTLYIGTFRITHEDGQEFESDEYILSDTNHRTSTTSDIQVKSEHETVQPDASDSSAEDRQGVTVKDDDSDIISVAR